MSNRFELLKESERVLLMAGLKEIHNSRYFEIICGNPSAIFEYVNIMSELDPHDKYSNASESKKSVIEELKELGINLNDDLSYLM